MRQWIKRRYVLFLCILGIISPFIGMSLIDTFYYSTVIGWVIGFLCFVIAYIIVSKSPDDDEAPAPPSATKT